MTVRFSSFIGSREVCKVEGGYTTRVYFELPHRMMLRNLTNDEIFALSEQCEELLANPMRPREVYLGNVKILEEVENKRKGERPDEVIA